jgi:hypothetical protein
MKKLAALILLVIVSSAALAVDRKASLHGPSGILTPVQFNWSAPTFITAGNSTTAALAQFKVTRSSTATNIYFTAYQFTAAGTGTGTWDLTDTGGTALCTVSVACASLAQGYTATGTCTAVLAPGIYQVRNKAVCGGVANGFGVIGIFGTTP